MRNIDSIFNKESSIQHIVNVNIFYKKHRERTMIDVVRGKLECNLGNDIVYPSQFRN